MLLYYIVSSKPHSEVLSLKHSSLTLTLDMFYYMFHSNCTFVNQDWVYTKNCLIVVCSSLRAPYLDSFSVSVYVCFSHPFATGLQVNNLSEQWADLFLLSERVLYFKFKPYASVIICYRVLEQWCVAQCAKT